MFTRLACFLLLPANCLALLPTRPTPPPADPLVRLAPTSADRDEELRDHRVFGYTNGQPRGIPTLLRVGDLGLTGPIRTAFVADFRAVFEGRMNKATLPDPSQLEVADEVLRSLEIRLQAAGTPVTDRRLQAIRHHLRHLPPMDDYSARPLRWKETPLANALFTRTQGPYHTTATLSIRRQVFYDRLTAEEQASTRRFFEELARLPRAYALYLRSTTEPRVWALASMDELLALPESERRELTALAHYRRARLRLSLPDWDACSDATVRQRLRQVRSDLTSIAADLKAGAHDFAQVGANAPGWLAYSYSMVLPARRLTALGEADYPGALATYLRLPERRQANGFNSTYWLIRKLAEEAAFEVCVGDPDLRMLMTIHLGASPDYAFGFGSYYDYASEAGPIGARGWLQALAAAGVGPDFAPHRIALLHLQIGDFPSCERILRTLNPRDPLTALIASHCNLRQGGPKAASIRMLTDALLAHPPGLRERHATITYLGAGLDLDLTDPQQVANRVGTELAALKLSEGDLSEAMRLFYAHGDISDGAYVAECLLSTDELRRLVDLHGYPDQDLPDDEFYLLYDQPHYSPRALLARKLFREDRWDEAARYFPPALAAIARRYGELRRLAAQPGATPRARADAHWCAALIIQRHGRALLFCAYGLDKTQPDRSGKIQPNTDPSFLEYANGWHAYLTSFLPHLRQQEKLDERPQVILKASPEETRRIKAWYAQHIEKPTYSERMPRYEVFRLGLLAVKDLPDNDPAGAIILQTIGNLLKYVDPDAAQPAYRLLVKRFGQTPLGATATKTRWFAKDRPSPGEDLLR